MSENKHGLTRSIPAEVMREVRRRCGFGCIICGSAIVQYHHFSPEFSDSKVHSSEGITLLCGSCHDKATRGLLGNDEVKRFVSDPFCMKEGFTHDFLFASRDNVHFQIGNATFRRHAVIVYDSEVLIGFEPPQQPAEPLRLFARIEDTVGAELIEIIDNEWRVGTHHFDVETVGNALVVRRKLGDITLRMRLKLGGEIVIERLQMGYKGYQIHGIDGEFTIKQPNGAKLTLACPNINSTLRLSSRGGVML